VLSCNHTLNGVALDIPAREVVTLIGLSAVGSLLGS
jgi:hypothetical protein